MNARDQFLQNRVILPTAKSSAEIARDIPAQIRARAFFSARVAEAHILERFRRISDDYTTGRIGRGEARELMRKYARAHGKDDGTESLKNLAGTARLELIVDQQERMAYAVGEHERMYSESALRVFPFVRYHASVGSKKPRSEHQKYDGMIFDKRDPWLRTHTPPWEFGCHCQLEQITAKAAGKTPDLIRPMTPPDQVKVESKSGFSFDPEHAFEEFDLGTIKDDGLRRNVYRQMASMATRTDAETTFLAAPAKPVPTCAKPENMGEIKKAFHAVKQSVDVHVGDGPYEFPEVKCPLGYIAKERFDAIGMMPEDNVPVIFESPGAAEYGMKHWRRHHLPDWKKADFEAEAVKMLEQTLWNPLATMRNTISKNGKRIDLISPDGKYVANLWRRGNNWVYSIQDAWDISASRNKNYKKS